VAIEEQSVERIFEDWLVREGFEPLSTERRARDFWVTSDRRSVPPQGRIYYRGADLAWRQPLRPVADRLTAMGVEWVAKRNDWGYWYLAVPLVPALWETPATA
jgi:hypothetical protein